MNEDYHHEVIFNGVYGVEYIPGGAQNVKSNQEGKVYAKDDFDRIFEALSQKVGCSREEFESYFFGWEVMANTYQGKLFIQRYVFVRKYLPQEWEIALINIESDADQFAFLKPSRVTPSEHRHDMLYPELHLARANVSYDDLLETDWSAKAEHLGVEIAEQWGNCFYFRTKQEAALFQVAMS